MAQMRTWPFLGLLLSVVMVMAACAAQPEGGAGPGSPAGASAAMVAPALDMATPFEQDGALTFRAFAQERPVVPDTDETFEFIMVNNTDGDLPVVVVLEHQDGERWNTSLCVQQQCLLGNGSEPSVTDPLVLPPYFEQPFQAHVFIDAAAQIGQSETLALRVEPQIDGIQSRSVTLNARVVQ